MRIIFTIGIFDVLNEDHFKLFHEMRKASIPGGLTYALIYEDYPAYKQAGKFPIQNYSHRFENLKYFVKNIHTLQFEDPYNDLKRFREGFQSDDKIICVMYDDNKNFPGRPIIKGLGIPIKFIKYEQNNNSDTA